MSLTIEACPKRNNGDPHCDHHNGVQYETPSAGQQTTQWTCCHCGRGRGEVRPIFDSQPQRFIEHGPFVPRTTVRLASVTHEQRPPLQLPTCEWEY